MPDLINKPIHILGAGGIGTVLAWSLASKGYSVILVDANPSKVSEGQKNGVTVEDHGNQSISLTPFDEWTPPLDSYILLCTKTYDNSSILARLPSNNTFLVPIQNGFDTQLEQHNHACECIAAFVSECQRDRPITRITRPGSLYIGWRRPITADERNNMESLAAALGDTGLFSVEVVEDIRPYKATKLMYNAAISPLAASAGVDNGELLTDQLAKMLFFSLLRENYGILRNARVPLARIGPFHPDTVSVILSIPKLPAIMAVFFRSSLQGTYCSMAPDISVGCYRTEIEAYNGHLIRLADNFPCPLNKAVFTLIEKMAQEGLKPQRELLQQLTTKLPQGFLH